MRKSILIFLLEFLFILSVCAQKTAGFNQNKSPYASPPQGFNTKTHTEYTASCEPTSVPYIMDFNNTTYSVLPACTSQEILDKTSGWFMTDDLPNGLGENNSMLLYVIRAGDPANTWFFTQGVALKAEVAYKISYLYSPAIFLEEKLNVLYGTSAKASAMVNWIASHPEITETAKEQIEFKVAEDAVYYFGFHVHSAKTARALYLGEIEIQAHSVCWPPVEIIATNIKSTSAQIAWENSKNAQTWDLEYSETGTVLGSGTRILGLSNLTYMLTGLVPNTEYTCYIRARCGEFAMESAWSEPKAFKTNIQPSGTPFIEGFEEGYTDRQVLHGGWVQQVVKGRGGWSVNKKEDSHNRKPRSGEVNIVLTEDSHVWIFHPIQFIGGRIYLLSFYARRSEKGTASIEVGFGSASELASMEYLAKESFVKDGEYQEFQSSFTPLSSGEYYIGIKGAVYEHATYLSIDDISVALKPLCKSVTDVKLVAVAETTASVSWKGSGAAIQEYRVEVYTSGAKPETDTPLFSLEVYASQSLIELTDLTPDSEYVVYVLSVCEEGEVKRSLPIRFTTKPKTDIVNYELPMLLAYPNPVSEILNLSSLKPINSYKIYAITGKQLLYGKHNGLHLSLDVTALVVGVYILRLDIEGSVYSLKFVKE